MSEFNDEFETALRRLDFTPYRWAIRFLCWVPVPWKLERDGVFERMFRWQYGTSQLLQSWEWRNPNQRNNP